MLIIHLIPEPVDDSSTPFIPPPSSSEELVDNPKNFAELQTQNADICGWLTLPDMTDPDNPGIISDYPILQSSDDPEDFYLDHDVSKKYKFAGSLYIQKMNYKDFSDPNTVIYGHNMINGSMFGKLKQFRNKDFFDKNETFYIYAPGHIYTYRIFSAFVYDNRHILNAFDFYSEDGFAAFLEQSLNPVSMVRNVREGVSVTTADRIVTFSTCTNNSKERYLVEGVLINDQLTR